MDACQDPVELTSDDLRTLAQLAVVLRSARAASAVIHLRRLLDERELQDLAQLLTLARGESQRLRPRT